MNRRDCIARFGALSAACLLPTPLMGAASSTRGAPRRVTLIGIGGAGGNLLNYMIRDGTEGANHLYINSTSSGRTEPVLARHRLEVGHSDDLSSDEMQRHLQGTNAVVILAGLGGGAGSSMTPVVARVARDLGVWVAAVVITPFAWEGERHAVATSALHALGESAHVVRAISNERMAAAMSPDTTLSDFFQRVNEAVRAEVRGLVGKLNHRRALPVEL